MMHSVLSLPQPLRFLLAGGVAAAVNWAVRFPLSAVMPFLPAVTVATIIGMMIGFVAYRLLVFPGSSRPVIQQIRDFVLVNTSSFLLVVIVAGLLRSVLLLISTPGVAEPVAHALGIAAGATLNYFGHSMVTFKSRQFSKYGASSRSLIGEPPRICRMFWML
jgi:energy-coupling factor transport system substrate-specific component